MALHRAPITLGAILLALLVISVGTWPAVGANNGKGQGVFKVRPFVEMQTTDGTIADFSATPTSSDPGPRAWDDSDRIRFNGRYTNTRHVVLLEVSNAQDSSSSSTKLVQGTTHTIADWVYARTDETTVFATVRAIGTSDASAGAYTAPGGFSQDGQGEVLVRTYDRTTPPDGGTTTTVSWIYDSGQNLYWFDAGDKDFTDGDGEVEVAPASKKAQGTYTFTVAGVVYAVASVAGAGQGFVPTVAQSWDKNPGVAQGEDFDVYLLMDFPSGTGEDTYAVTIRASIQATK